MRKTLLWTLAFCVVALPSNTAVLHAREVKPEPYGSPLGKAIDKAVLRATQGGFWGTILVQRGGKKVLEKGYGSSDYASWPATTHTPYEIASCSKQFTAAAILKLEQQEKLKTSDTLAKFFPDIPNDKKDIRVIHLLQHTSGLSNRIGVPYDSPMSRDAYVSHILKTPRTHEPGEHFAYNNAGYALLAAIVEVASGTSFEAYSHEALFKPSRMKATGFIRDAKLMKDPRTAMRLGDPSERNAADWHWGWGYRGMGGVITNSLDLARWDRKLRTDSVLGPEAKAKFYRPAPSGYACGWRVNTTARGTTKVHHGGSVKGFSCYVSRFLEEDALIVILTNNRRDIHTLEKLIADKLFAPAQLKAIIDGSPYTLSKSRSVELENGLSWTVSKGTEEFAIRLMDNDGKTLALLRVPKGYAGKIVAGLERGIAARARDDDGKAAAMEGGIFFAAYPAGTKRLELDEQLEITILPQYRGVGKDGERIVDNRVVFVLQDAKHRMWPVMVKMNVAAARGLLERLR